MPIDEIVCKGQKSKRYLESMYKENKPKNTFFNFEGIDKYGRVLGIIYFGDLNVNNELLKNGGCLEYRY